MSVGSVNSSVMSYIQQPQMQQVSPQRDNDGDNDSSRAGEVEQAESKVSSTGKLGSVIDVMA